MSNFYGATGLIGGASGDLDNIDGTNLASGDGAFVVTSTALYVYYLNASSGAAESSPDIISPDANASNKRWILVDIVGEDAVMELLKLYDTDKTQTISLKWNEDDTGSRVLNILVGGGDRSITLNEDFTVGDGGNVTITAEDAAGAITLDNCSLEVEDTVGSGNTIKFIIGTDDASRTVILSENFTIGDGHAGTIVFSAASKILTVSETMDAGAHKNRHDPADGADPVDTAAASEIAGVQAAAIGSSHSLARSDHAHQIQHGIVDNHLVTVDQAGAASGEYGRFTANGLEGRSFSEVRSDINVASGADVTGSNAPQAHAASHKTSGSDEIDGDQIDIDFTPTNYTPDTTPAEASSVDNLSAHLSGIDNTLGGWMGLSWNESTDAYARRGSLAGQANGASPGNALLPIQAAMRRCVMSDAGVVQYYLDPDDSTKKADGAASVLDGTDGQVMVEIPKFYVKYGYAANVHTWDISLFPLAGFVAHPAFYKDGAWVDYRYMGTYEGSMYDDTAGAMCTDATAITDIYASGDKLCSITGQCPKTNETRAEFRAMASERGAGWRNQDYFLTTAVQLLYLIEYADFDSQSMISNGRTMFSAGSWVIAGTAGYIGRTGYSNSDGNASGGSSRAAALNISAIDTSEAAYNDYMSYRGIENFFGNVWKWIDGININDNIPYVCNNEGNYADDTDTNYTRLVTIGGVDVTLHNANGDPATIAQIQAGFLAESVGASSATKMCDYYYQDADWRVVTFGGPASSALYAGAFYVFAYNASSYDYVNVGGRLCF